MRRQRKRRQQHWFARFSKPTHSRAVFASYGSRRLLQRTSGESSRSPRDARMGLHVGPSPVESSARATRSHGGSAMAVRRRSHPLLLQLRWSRHSTGPGAPATFTFGPELTPAEQARVRRGLDAGARYYRAVLGRELPPLSAWAYRDLEALLGTYVQNEPISADDARRLWTGGQVGHATPRKVWLGPAWFQNAEASALKIAAHEAFHLLQYEVIGQRPMSVSTLDEIPPAGPWWLAEGSAEYFAYLAIARDGALRIADVRSQWLTERQVDERDTSCSRHSPRPARDAEPIRHLRARDGSPAPRSRPGAPIQRTTRESLAERPGRMSFAATFGRSYDAFVDEFESYRAAS